VDLIKFDNHSQTSNSLMQEGSNLQRPIEAVE
jgi:hypothetical protein